MTRITGKLKDGTQYEGVVYSKDDYKGMVEFLHDIRWYNSFLNHLGGRKINIPDVISEGIYCYLFNCARTNGSAKSYDAVDLKTKEGIQIKSASIHDDCTSFGPTSTWDRLIFIDFSEFISNESNKVYFYHIKENISSLVLNNKKHETFHDQQSQGRRPRLTVRHLIENDKLKPIKIVTIPNRKIKK